MRVLLIEDSSDIAEAIEAKLLRQGHHVEVARDGNIGLELASSDSFEVVVLDINLPGRDGFEVLREMRRRNTQSAVLVVTARNQVSDKISLLDLGADDYIVKPFDLSELAARIRAVSRRHMGFAQPNLVLGGLDINLSTRAAMLGGKPLDLGKREFAVLELLASGRGQAASKDHIQIKLFGHDDIGSPNAVELLVSRLRKKLEGSDVEIVTQWGVGYLLRLVEPASGGDGA